MGLVLDASVLIGAEREGKPVSEVLRVLKEQHGETEILLSVITVRWSTVFTAPVPLSAPSAAGTIGTQPLLRFQRCRSADRCNRSSIRVWRGYAKRTSL